MTPETEVPIAWDALEDAFENNAPQVHSYLHLETGEVIRIVDGVADPTMHDRIMGDDRYLCVDPVSSREQYRWMERFIATVEDVELRQTLLASIDGKGAFRRFKDALMGVPEERERWFTFRSARLRASMDAWLLAHSIQPVSRPDWPVPATDEPRDVPAPATVRVRTPGVEGGDRKRKRLSELAGSVPTRELDAAIAFLEFLGSRRAPIASSNEQSEPVEAS